MMSTLTCLHCCKSVPPNPRINNQKYCSGKECQRARKRSWKKEQYRNNRYYRQKHLEIQKLWSKKRPGYQYQREYREKHPEYVERNRELQHKRTEKQQQSRQIVPLLKIVNGNSIFTRPGDDGTYALMRVNEGNIVNGNAIMVRMQILSW